MKTLTALILTFNVWGVPDFLFIKSTPDRAWRMGAICNELKAGAWDVVLLQEVWLEEDRRRLSNCGYPHQLRTHGLLTLSRHPLGRAYTFRFPAPKPFSRVEHFSEVFARKGVHVAEIISPAGRFWVANTHLVAKYDDNDVYEDDREEQLSLFLGLALGVAGDDPIILGGDLNVDPSDSLWQKIPSHLVTETADCTSCPWNTHQDNDKSIDHLFGSKHWRVKRGGLAFENTVGGMHLSDHFGWETEFEK